MVENKRPRIRYVPIKQELPPIEEISPPTPGFEPQIMPDIEGDFEWGLFQGRGVGDRDFRRRPGEVVKGERRAKFTLGKLVKVRAVWDSLKGLDLSSHKEDRVGFHSGDYPTVGIRELRTIIEGEDTRRSLRTVLKMGASSFHYNGEVGNPKERIPKRDKSFGFGIHPARAGRK